MTKYLALSLLIGSAFSQTAPVAAPAPPACLSGPVTLGSVTLTCSAIDNTAYGQASDPANYGYLFQVRLTSTDPDVIGMRVVLSWQTTVADPRTGPIPGSREVNIAKTEDTFLYTFSVPRSVDTAIQKQAPLSITSVKVQETKASSTQTF